jgi:hypothetical protein
LGQRSHGCLDMSRCWGMHSGGNLGYMWIEKSLAAL